MLVCCNITIIITTTATTIINVFFTTIIETRIDLTSAATILIPTEQSDEMLIYDDAPHEGRCGRPDLSIGHGLGKKMSVNVAQIVCTHRI